MIGDYSISNIIIFSVLVIAALVLDLTVHRQDKPVSMKSAAVWSMFWIALSLAFAGYIWYDHGSTHATLFLTGYLLEKSLSVDNLFVMMAIFASFSIPDRYQHRVLYFGIIGALLFRLIFVALGATLLASFGTWVLLAFGFIVLYSAFKMYKSMSSPQEELTDYSGHWSVRFASKVFPVHNQLVGHNFFTRVNGKTLVTPLFICLIAIELADIMFAFDSVPAIFSITQEPFLVYSSNVFAILGLRSLYFLLAGARRWLVHLDKAVIAILAFVGLKMIIETMSDILPKFGIEALTSFAGYLHYPAWINLVAVLGLLVVGVLASLIFPEKNKSETPKE